MGPSNGRVVRRTSLIVGRPTCTLGGDTHQVKFATFTVVADPHTPRRVAAHREGAGERAAPGALTRGQRVGHWREGSAWGTGERAAREPLIALTGKVDSVQYGGEAVGEAFPGAT